MGLIPQCTLWLIFKKTLAHKLKLVLSSLTGVSFCLKVKSKNDYLLILQIWVDLLGRIAIRNKTSQKQEPLGEKLEISINKSKVSMNVLKVHLLYLEGRNVDSSVPYPHTAVFWKSKTTKLFALKFCDILAQPLIKVLFSA